MPPASPTKINVFEYLDYRKFIQESQNARKAGNPAFSYRLIAARIGSTSGSLTRILKGQLNLGTEMAAKLARLLGLNEAECEYFETLVLFCQAKTMREQNLFLEKLLRLRGTKVRTLEEGQFQYFRKWYYSAVRELLNFFPFDGNYQKLARSLRPPITNQEAREAVALLIDLGLLEKQAVGGYRLAEKFITSGESVRAIHMDNFNLSMCELACTALGSTPVAERDFSGLTLSIPPDLFPDIREMLRLFRQELLEKVRKSRDPGVVYRLNLQMFPLSRIQEPGKP